MTLREESRSGFFSELLRLLAPSPGRLQYALRLALICALTALVVEFYQTPDAALTVYVAFFVNKPDRAESVLLALVMTILISLIIGLIILMAILVIDAPMWRVVLMSVFSFGFLFIAFASKLRPLGGTITLIVGYALDLLGSIQVGELATRALLYAWLFVAIPAGVSIVVNLLLAPAPRRLAQRAIAQRLVLAADLIEAPGERSREALIESMREGADEIGSWLKLAGAEKTSPRRDIEALGRASRSTTAILSWVEVMTRADAEPLPASLCGQLARTLHEMAAILQKGGYPVEISFEPGEPMGPWGDIRVMLAGFAEEPAVTAGGAELSQAGAPHPAGFFVPDAFTNPEYVRYALKTTAAAMFCYILYSLLNWPGIHTCFITCYIVSLGTTAETVEKLSLRVLGCIVGAAVGIAAIVYVMPSLTSIEALLAVVFIGGLAAAWVAAGSPRISYAGFQIAFAFFLCVIQGASPAFDLTIARDRVIGILLGNIVVYILFTRTWPTSVGERIDPAISAVLRKLSAMTTAASADTRRTLAAQVQGSLGSIEQNLALARYEPTTIRPSEDWLRLRRRAVEEIGSLQGPLLLRAERGLTLSADFSQRLEHSADAIDTHVEGMDEALKLIHPLEGPNGRPSGNVPG